MDKLFTSIKTYFPKSVIQFEKKYVSFTFSGGIYYQLRVQKDKVRMMATNYPAKAKKTVCQELIKKYEIEGFDINGRKIILEEGARNPEIFTLRLEFPYESYKQLDNNDFIDDILDSCVKFHDKLIPLVNQFMKAPVGDFYKLMGADTSTQLDKVGNSFIQGESIYSKMIVAFKEGNLDQVAQFIEEGNPPLQFNQDGSLIENELIFICAASEVDLNRLESVIKQGVDLNAKNVDKDQYTALHFCAWDGKVDAIKVLLRNGALPDIIGNDGRTALHLASANGHAEVVDILIAAGVDVNRRIPNDFGQHYSENGSSALRDALFNQYWEVVQILLNNAADIKMLSEPCIQSLEGSFNLFDVIRISNKNGIYPEGLFDEKKLYALQKEVELHAQDSSENISYLDILKRNHISNTNKSVNGILPQEHGINDLEFIDENTSNDQSNNQKISDLNLSAIDVTEESVIDIICEKIKNGKYLTNLLYVNKVLYAKGFETDNHQAYFFDSNVLISDRELKGFLVVNMDGFYSNCMNEDEMSPIFSWSGVNDIEFKENQKDSSIDIVADNGRLTIRKEGSNSLKILFILYQHVWKLVNERFKDEPAIFWNEVWDMGIKEIGFKTTEEYFSFNIETEEIDDEREEITNQEESSTSVGAEETLYNVYLSTSTPNKLSLVKYLSNFLNIRIPEAKELADKNESILLCKEVDLDTAEQIKAVAESNTGCNVVLQSALELSEEVNENKGNDNGEELAEEENNQVDPYPYTYNVDSQDYSFADRVNYKSYFDTFLTINEKTRILNFEITREPNEKEREDLWGIVRKFCERIYQLDNDVHANKHEINVLSHFTVVALHWCDIQINDWRFSYSNGRFRRDTLALALCIFARVSRDYDKYDYLKTRWIIPHTRFSFLMWSLRSIIDGNEDNIFSIFSVKNAQNAMDTFLKIDADNQKKGQTGYVDIDDLPDSNSLKNIGIELKRLFKNNRIPYQFILNYIWLKPKESYFKKISGSTPTNISPARVCLLEIDFEHNKEFLISQIKHKEFPAEWSFENDLVFIYSYFAKITDGILSEYEKETIIEKLSEWIGEDKPNGKEKIMTIEKFKLGFAEFEKDPHVDRFHFVLDNIRRHFYISYDGDEQKILAQLKNVMTDLYAIAESDSRESEYAISDKERELLDEIDCFWRTGDYFEDEALESVDINNQNDSEDNFQEFVENYQEEFYCDNVWERKGYMFEIKPFPNVFGNMAEKSLIFRKFTLEEVDSIVSKIKSTKSFILLPFVKEILQREFDLKDNKPPFWFIPFVGYGNDIGSLMYFTQDGIYNCFKSAKALSNTCHIDMWTNISVESGYNGLFDDSQDDKNISSLKIDWTNPSSGNSGHINIVEMHGVDFGATLNIVKAIWDSAWKTVVDRSKGASQFLLGPPPNVESFDSWEDLLKWANS